MCYGSLKAFFVCVCFIIRLNSLKRHHLLLFRQDITGFRGTIEELNQFNEAGRAKLALLRKSIERLDDYVADLNNATLSAEIDSHRQQFTR